MPRRRRRRRQPVVARLPSWRRRQPAVKETSHWRRWKQPEVARRRKQLALARLTCWRRSSNFSQLNCTTNAEEKRQLPRTVKHKVKELATPV